MSDSSPLIPQGSLLEEQAKGRPHLRIALCIVAVHMVFLGGLLMQGCKREEPTETADLVLPPLVTTNLPPTMEPWQTDDEPDSPSIPTNVPPAGMGTNPWPDSPVVPVDTNLPSPPTDPSPEPEPPSTPEYVEYKVQRGEYFITIARKFDVTAADIAAANPGIDSTRLQIGQVLRIPTVSSAPPPSSEPDGALGAPTGEYTVKRGDTLTRIARQYGTTVSALKELNGLTTDRIIINQKLKVPASPGGGTPGN